MDWIQIPITDPSSVNQILLFTKPKYEFLLIVCLIALVRVMWNQCNKLNFVLFVISSLLAYLNYLLYCMYMLWWTWETQVSKNFKIDSFTGLNEWWNELLAVQWPDGPWWCVMSLGSGGSVRALYWNGSPPFPSPCSHSPTNQLFHCNAQPCLYSLSVFMQ